MASLLKCIMMFQVSQLFGTKLLSWNNLCILTPSFGEQKGIMPPQARRPMVLDHLADYWSGPVQWTNGPDQSEVLIYDPRLIQGV